MRGRSLRRTWPFACWLIALVLLPWWLGLPLLLGIAAALLTGAERLHVFQAALRLALRWGVPGAALASARSVDEPTLGWTIAAVAALAGFTLLAGLEAWLDRDRRRASAGASAAPVPEWSELALAPLRVGGIIELEPVGWRPPDMADAGGIADPRGGCVHYVVAPDPGGYLLGDGVRVDSPVGRTAFSPDGRWFAIDAAGLVLWDRDVGCLHRLGRSRLAGWHDGRPWLQDGDVDMPHPLPGAASRPHHD